MLLLLHSSHKFTLSYNYFDTSIQPKGHPFFIPVVISTNSGGLWKESEDYDDNGVDNLDEATIDGTPSWQILNLDYRLNINENLVASFSLENIFDAHYKTFGSGISASGRNFVVSLTSKF